MATLPRRVAAVVSVAGVGALLAGCASGSENAAVDATPTSGGDLVFAVSSTFSSFDPNITASAPDARVIRQVFDSLVDLDDDGAIVPWLAESWDVSDDGLTYAFALRDDVEFHDGTPFDADAVCFNLDRIADPETASLYAVSLIGPYASCEATDATTATVTLDEPYAAFLTNLSTPFLGIVSPRAAEEAGIDDFGIEPVGTGPFAFESYTPNSEVVLTRNADYAWPAATAEHDGAAYLESLTFQIVTDSTVRLGSLRNGDADAIGDVPAQEVSGVEEDASLQYFAPAQAGAVYQLFFNTSRPGMDDPAVRRALAAAMNVDTAVAATYFGAYTPADAPLSPETVGAGDQPSRIPFDPEAAVDELEDAGWTAGSDGVREKDGQRLSFTFITGSPSYDSRNELFEFVRTNIEDIGIEIEVQAVPSAEYGELYAAGEYDIVATSFVAVDPDILYTLYHSSSYFNMAHIDSLDDALTEGRRAAAGPEREQIYADVQAEIIDQAYSVPQYELSFHMATSEALQGLRFDAAAYPIFSDAYLAE